MEITLQLTKENTVRYTLLGNSGLRVSEVALGTMTFGTDWGWGAPADESARQFELFAEAGGTLIDTANNYTNGTAESVLGDLLAADRAASSRSSARGPLRSSPTTSRAWTSACRLTRWPGSIRPATSPSASRTTSWPAPTSSSGACPDSWTCLQAGSGLDKRQQVVVDRVGVRGRHPM